MKARVPEPRPLCRELAKASLTGERVAELLDEVAGERGYPKSITVDNGFEFYSQAMDSRAHHTACNCGSFGPGSR